MERRLTIERGTVAGIWLSESIVGHLNFWTYIGREKERERKRNSVERETTDPEG